MFPNAAAERGNLKFPQSEGGGRVRKKERKEKKKKRVLREVRICPRIRDCSDLVRESSRYVSKRKKCENKREGKKDIKNGFAD